MTLVSRSVWCALAVVVSSSGARPLAAVDGALDPSFSLDGKQLVIWNEGDPTSGWAQSVAVLGDGSMVVAGKASGGAGFVAVAAKLTRTGLPDVSWGEDGRRRLHLKLSEGAQDAFLGAFPNPDGTVLFAGSTGFTDHANCPFAVRLLGNGDPDSSYGDDGYSVRCDFPWPNAQATVTVAARQRDGKLLIAGNCTFCPSNGDSDVFVLRLLENGAPDPSFSSDGWEVVTDSPEIDELFAIAATADGRVVLGLRANNLPRLRRLTASAAVDNTFSGDGILDPDLEPGDHTFGGMTIDPDNGQLYVGMNSIALSVPFGFVLRYNFNGTLDSTWGDDGRSTVNLEEGVALTSVALQGDGRLMFAGEINATGAQQLGFLLGRLDAAGETDDTFDDNGINRYEFDRQPNAKDSPFALSIANGKPVAAGYAALTSGFRAFAVLRVENSYLFADGFDAGETRSWSSTTPTPP